MRKNHHGKKDRLVKRVFALCLALAVICTCLVPVFATEGLSDLQVEKELPGTSEEEAAGFGDDFPAVDDGEPREVYDDSEAAGFGEEEASRPVEGGEDNLDGGPTVTDSEWGTVIDYGTSTSTSTDTSSSTETQWSGEDDVVEKPDDKVVVSGDEIKKLQDMVVYRFWLRELNTLDLQDITAQAQINNMTESEYLARNGEVLWNLYFIQAVPRAETIADYSSYIENPSSNRDPKGELRQFDYWYTLDEFGNRVRLNLTDPTSNILDDKTTTVNVYAAWKDGTVGSDEEEKVDHEDLVDKNPVPVDLTAKAAASYEDEEGNTKSVNLPVEVKNLPSATDHLNVTHMGDNSMTEFCDTYKSELQGMQPLLGLKITPEDINSEKVHLAKGQKATVTVSGLNELPDVAEMEEMGALTADALKVLHQKDDNTVEKLDVVSYENGTLTFETTSFSPFVIALEYPDQGSEDCDSDGIEIVSIEIDGVEYPNVNDGIATISSIQGDTKVPVGATITLHSNNGKSSYYHKWIVTKGTAEFVGSVEGWGDKYKTVKLKLTTAGHVQIKHRYGKAKDKLNELNIPTGGTGIYVYKITEKDNGTPAVSYNTDGGRLYLIVTVTHVTDGNGNIQDGLYNYAVALRRGDDNITAANAAKGTKVLATEAFHNTYGAGNSVNSVELKKTVHGNFGDLGKDFTFNVTFNKAVDKNYGNIAFEAENGRKVYKANDPTQTGVNELEYGVEYVVTLKHGETIEFGNLPADVTYTMVENGKQDVEGTQKVDGIYTVTGEKTEDNKGTVTASATTAKEEIVNTNQESPDMGVVLDNAPYIAMLAIVAIGGVALMLNKRRRDEE